MNVTRVLQARQIPDDGDFLFRSMVRDQYKESYEYALDIKALIEKNQKLRLVRKKLFT